MRGRKRRRRAHLFILALALVALGGTTALAQGSDPLPPEEPAAPLADPPPAAPTDPGAPGAGGADPGSVGGADPGSAGGADPGSAGGADPGSAGGADPGSAGGADPGSAGGADPGGTGSASVGSNAPAPIVIVIPPDVQAPDVSAAASPSIVRLGQKFTLFVTATHATDVEVNLREPLELGPAFEVVRRSSENRTSPDGRKVREWQLEVYAWELGDLRVPPIGVTFTSHGKAGQVATNAVPLHVTGVLGDLVDDPKLVRGDAPPARLMSRDWFWAWLAGGVAAVLALVTVALWLRSRRRRRVRTLLGTLVVSYAAEPRRLDMTSERALEQLLAIEQSGVLERDDDRKRGYAEMVQVIREYTGARYRVASLDLTTAELLRTLAKVAPDDERAQIASLLERCDIVKYGGLRTTADDARAVLDAARTLVMTTTRAPGRAA
jgi:hypothetical protein